MLSIKKHVVVPRNAPIAALLRPSTKQSPQSSESTNTDVDICSSAYFVPIFLLSIAAGISLFGLTTLFSALNSEARSPYPIEFSSIPLLGQ